MSEVRSSSPTVIAIEFAISRCVWRLVAVLVEEEFVAVAGVQFQKMPDEVDGVITHLQWSWFDRCLGLLYGWHES